MIKAIRIHRTGGPAELVYEDVALDAPGPGEAIVCQEAIGLNYIDTYQRSGLYPLPKMPWVLGMEAAGTVEAVGQGVSEVTVGDRVAYACAPPGAYAEARCLPAAKLVILPDAISTEQAASVMLQGMTTEYLLNRCHAAATVWLIFRGPAVAFSASTTSTALDRPSSWKPFFIQAPQNHVAF